MAEEANTLNPGTEEKEGEGFLLFESYSELLCKRETAHTKV